MARKTCEICKTSKEMTVHHIMPRNIDIDDSAENLANLCRLCHDHIETLYRANLQQMNPLYSQKEEIESRKNRAISYMTYYQKLIEDKNEDKLQEYYQKFIEKGYKLWQFNTEGHKKFAEDAMWEHEQHKLKLKREMINFDWKTFYRSCKDIIAITARFRKEEN